MAMTLGTRQTTNWVRTHPDEVLKLPNDREWFTSDDIPIKGARLQTLESKGVIRKVGKHHTERGRYEQRWRMTDKALALREEIEERESDGMLPCSCEKDGFHNVENGGFACVVCGEEFERGELNV
jgi:hypothetical protein